MFSMPRRVIQWKKKSARDNYNNLNVRTVKWVWQSMRERKNGASNKKKRTQKARRCKNSRNNRLKWREMNVVVNGTSHFDNLYCNFRCNWKMLNQLLLVVSKIPSKELCLFIFFDVFSFKFGGNIQTVLYKLIASTSFIISPYFKLFTLHLFAPMQNLAYVFLWFPLRNKPNTNFLFRPRLFSAESKKQTHSFIIIIILFSAFEEVHIHGLSSFFVVVVASVKSIL